MALHWHDAQTGEARTMSQADLDACVSPSRFVASLDDELQIYAERSAAAREAARAAGCLHEGLEYAAGDAAKLDLFLPAGDQSAPLLVYIHGGFWQQLSRADSAFAAPDVTRHGGGLAALGYTLAPRASLAEIVQETREALVWLYRQCALYGLDRKRIVVAGSSAGAHLAAMLMLTDWTQFELPEQIIAGAVLVSGVYDLSVVAQSYVNEPLSLSTEGINLLSPRRLMPRHTCPVHMVFSANEPDEFKRESHCYARHLTRHGQSCVVREIAGRHHFDVVLDLADPDTALGHATLSMLGLSPPLKLEENLK